MQGHTEASVQRYLELSGKHQSSLHPVATPCMEDHLLDPADDDKKGVLKEEPAKRVLKALYVARYNRIDLLWAVNALVREVTKWTVNCCKRLHRLVCYMHFTSHLELQCWVGDRPEDIQLALFADASFALWLGDSKSTLGTVLCLMGPNTYVPISWFCKKQGSISNSSTESELISLDAALRMEGIPALELWDCVIDVFCPLTPAQLPIEVQKKPETIHDHLAVVDYVPPNLPLPNGRACLILLEDNDPVIQICIKGRNCTALCGMSRVFTVLTPTLVMNVFVKTQVYIYIYICVIGEQNINLLAFRQKVLLQSRAGIHF